MVRVIDEAREVALRRSVFTDAAELGPALRETDLAEIRAITDSTPEAALLESMSVTGSRAMTVTVRGVPIIMLGIAPHPDDSLVGVPWLMASPAMYEIADLFVQEQHVIFEALADDFSSFINVTSMTNPSGLRWLEGMGFTIGQTLTGAGRNGEDLVVFTRS